MKLNRLFIILSLFVAGVAIAATSQVNNVLQEGGVTNGGSSLIMPVTSGQSLKVLNARVAGASSTANNYVAFASYSSAGNDAQQYVVPGGKTFTATGFYALSGGNTISDLQFGYGTAPLISGDTATAPAGNVRYGAATTAANGGLKAWFNTAPGVFYPLPIGFPTGAYPYFRMSTAGVDANVQIIGYEQNYP